MTFLTHRTGTLSLLAGVLCLFTATERACAQTEPKPADENGRIAMIKGHDVYVRCGAAESYYPFAQLNDGDLVKVTGEKYEWSRVMAVGPAFNASFGFIKYSKGESGKFKLAADGKSGVTLGKIDIIAPNLDARNNPKDSWKALVRLDADQALRVIETIETDKDTIHKVALPESAQGWVSTAYLVAATPEQTQQWADSLTAKTKSRTESEKPVTASKTTTSDVTAPANDSVKPAPAQTTAASTNEPKITAESIEPAVNGETSPPSSESAAEVAAAPTAPAVEPKLEPKKLPTMDDLEVALKRLQKEPIDSAEVGPLRELYLDLADRSANEPRIVRYANGRAEQLQVWADLQKKRNELESLRARTRMSAEEAIAVQKALESSAEYVAVGRVAASTIYDGKSLPKLLRLQDASSGRTVAYLQPDEQYQVVNLIGNLVGVVGEKTYDGSLRLNIVEPRRIDLLMPEQRQAGAPVDQQRPE